MMAAFMRLVWRYLRNQSTQAVYAALIAAAAVLLVWGASHAAAYSDLNWLSYDFTVDHVGLSTSSKDIVFVDVDENTFNAFHTFPFPRTKIAEIIAQVVQAKPHAVGLDVLLSEPRSPEEDKAMRQALDLGTPTDPSAPILPIILASFAQLDPDHPATVPLPAFCQQDPQQANFCLDNSGASGYAYVNLPLDADGFIRQAFVELPQTYGSGAKREVLSFPAELAQDFTGKEVNDDPRRVGRKAEYGEIDGRKFPYWDRNLRSFLIGSWAKEPATAISALKILRHEVPASALAGKLVLIGQSNSAANDQQFTPLYRRADNDGARIRMPGTQILAAAIRTLLEGTAVRSTPAVLTWGAAVLLCWAASYLLLRLSTGVGIISVIVLAVLGVAISWGLYAYARIWLPFLPDELAVELAVPLTLGVQFFSERIVAREANAQRKQMMGLFASYVDPAVADTIWKRRGEVSLAGEERVATVMFTDIRSFTALSYGKPPADVLKWLNEYLSAMDEVIREYGGFLNKFIGDGLMIIFGLPLSKGVCDDAQRAMRAAQAMLDRVERLNREASGDASRPCLRIGIGVHSGTLMAGSIGSATRQEYSVIGETVNLASRLESQNKTFKTEILFSEATRTLLGSSFPGIVSMGGAKVPGLEDPVPVYTLAKPQQPGAAPVTETHEETKHEHVTT